MGVVLSDPFAPSDVLNMARQWIESGQPTRGIAQLEAQVSEPESTAGAFRDLAWGLWWVERQAEAVAQMQKATRCENTGPIIAYLAWRDLGLMRASVHQFEESLQALEMATLAEEKLAVAPPAAKPLLLARAEISLYANKPKQALALALGVMEFSREAIPQALVIAAEARALQGQVSLEPFLPILKTHFANMVGVLTDRVEQGDPAILRHVALEMLEVFPDSIPDAQKMEIALLNTLVRLDALVKDLPAKAKTLSRLMSHYAKSGDRPAWAQARLEWIRNQIDRSQLEGLDLALEELEAIGKGEGWGSFHASATRQRGRLEACKGNNPLAREAFRLAIQLSRAAGDESEAGRAEVVLGIQLFHEGEDVEAIRWLDMGLEHLDHEDEHAKAALHHRGCIIDRKPCACFQKR